MICTMYAIISLFHYILNGIDEIRQRQICFPLRSILPYFRCTTVKLACDISLFRMDLPIFEQISLFGISKFPYITYTSPYFKFLISLFEIKNFLLCLIILPISKSKSPYLAFQMYHMYAELRDTKNQGQKMKIIVLTCKRL